MASSKAKTRGKLKRAIARVAPTLAGAIGGPLAGAAVEQVSKAIFGDEVANEEKLSEALLAASPEQIVALQKAERDFALALRKAQTEERRIDAADRADARARQVAMKDWAPSVLGVLIIAGFFVVLAAMIARRLPVGAETEFAIMLGALATMTAAVVNYFFGSSAGSKEKTRLMAFPETQDKPGGDNEAA